MKKLVPIIIMILSLSPLYVYAHEGHGVVENGPAHFVFSFEHALPIIAVAALVFFIVRKKILKRT